MKYIGLRGTEVEFGPKVLYAKRSLSFILLDRANWDTNKLLRVLATKASGVLETVTLFGVFKNPATGTIAHRYDLVFKCCEKQTNNVVPYGVQIDEINKIVAGIEDELERSLSVMIGSRHGQKT